MTEQTKTTKEKLLIIYDPNGRIQTGNVPDEIKHAEITFDHSNNIVEIAENLMNLFRRTLDD